MPFESPTPSQMQSLHLLLPPQSSACCCVPKSVPLECIRCIYHMNSTNIPCTMMLCQELVPLSFSLVAISVVTKNISQIGLGRNINVNYFLSTPTITLLFTILSPLVCHCSRLFSVFAQLPEGLSLKSWIWITGFPLEFAQPVTLHED
jgi:hypothetical protein